MTDNKMINNIDNNEIPKICLNMIVKNESKVILRLLNSVLPIIDSYCICDTGSTDNTIELIEIFFKEKGINGRIVREPFKDFGYNRTFALHSCIGLPNADYLLLMDADMVLKINPKLCTNNFRKSLIKDGYFLFQGSDSFYYKNMRILKNNPEFSYWGVTHEYVKMTSDAVSQELDKELLFIIDIGDGGSKTDKFERDIRLLLKGLEEIPDNDRYTFYLANSYFSIENFEKAIEYYKKRIELGGWNQEVWYSYYYIGNSYKALGDHVNAIYYWMEAYQYFPDRIENLYKIVEYYRIKGKNNLSYIFYELADYQRNNNNKTNDHLFLEKDIYDYKLDYEFTILAYYRNTKNIDVIFSCMKVLSHPGSDEGINRNILSNYKFYTKKICLLENLTSFENSNLLTLNRIGDSIHIDRNIYLSSTPSLFIDPNNKNKLIINVRYVSYRIDDKGNYSSDEFIRTKNVIAIIDISNPNFWKKTKEFELKYNECYDSRYVGLEDIRLFSNNETIYFNANRGLSHEKMVIETGIINLKSEKTQSHLIYKDDQKEIEKNWVLFKNKNRELKMIYGWFPLTIGNIEEDSEKKIDDKNQMIKKFKVIFQQDTPNFFRWVRGSTNGITLGDEIWFICHLVSYEERRYYYHLFVVLDSNTMRLKKYTQLFTFEKEKVEYTLGFVYLEQKNQFLIGYSILDSKTKYTLISKNDIDKLFLSR
jgi:tetratricopeptide (TPR) repeat protein